MKIQSIYYKFKIPLSTLSALPTLPTLSIYQEDDKGVRVTSAEIDTQHRGWVMQRVPSWPIRLFVMHLTKINCVD
jgi:hypothetical protein